ncbi:glycosyltransferase family 4 protein [Halopelagius fulvigenes]|uniref:Glycosyltransferase family 4 protein n=1 Tax=Halopelagius fulvigenes TaxID=1198324 RepID=A0ABD5TVM0_9EURY
MSRILFLARGVPFPPNSGDSIVTYGFVRALANRGHDVHLLAYARDDDAETVPGVRDVCESIVRVEGTESPLPPTARKVARAALGRSDVMEMFDADSMREAAARRITTLSPDVVVGQHPYLARAFRDEDVRAAAAWADARLVTSAHVVEFAAHRLHRATASDVKTRAELSLEIPRLRREELATYQASDRVLVLGERDRRRLEERVTTPVKRQRVAIDAAEYETADRPVEGKRLLFFGSYEWFPNEDGVLAFAEGPWPEIREVHPDAEFVVAGRDANDAVRSLGERPGITFAGEVEDIGAAVRDAAVMVTPLRIGGGVRIKILESMAWETPIVTTRRGFEGVDAEPGEDVLVADDWDEFVAGTNRLLSDPEERKRLAANARERIETAYAPDDVAAELESNLGIDGS